MGNIGDSSGAASPPGSGRLELAVPASLEGVDRAVEAARAFFSRAGRANLFPVLTALREALLNAATHGCGLNASLTFHCLLALEGRLAVVTVADPGPGHDWRARIDAPCTAAVSGRGLCLMRHYARTVAHNERGNEITLRIDLDAESKHER